MIGECQDEQSRQGEHQAQQQQSQDLDHHSAGQHTLDRKRRSEQQVQVGIEQQGVEAEEQAAEDQDTGIAEKCEAQQVNGIELDWCPLGGLNADPGDDRFPRPGDDDDGRTDDGAGDPPGLMAAQCLVEEHLQLGSPEQ